MTVAAAAPAAARNPSRRRLILVLLTVSLALNFCFIAGAVWIRIHTPPPSFGPAERLHAMASELKLEPQQKIAFEQYFRAMRTRAQQMQEEVEPLIVEAWSEVSKPQADETRVMRLFDEAAEKRRAFQREATTQTIAFLATLSPEQRAEFVALARERHRLLARRPGHGAPP